MRPGRGRLSGRVKVDEIYACGRRTERKAASWEPDRVVRADGWSG